MLFHLQILYRINFNAHKIYNNIVYVNAFNKYIYIYIVSVGGKNEDTN